MEGTHCYDGDECRRDGLVLPVHEYPRRDGMSITGGYVYRGTALPQLVGAYVYADYVSGNVWALRVDESLRETSNDLLLESSGVSVSSFAEDASGELYLLDHGAGVLYKLAAAPRVVSAFPLKLSETGCFTRLAPLTPATGVVAYQVNSELWSDGAEKQRFVKAAGGAIGFRAEGAFDVPTGTVLLKHFALPQRDGTRKAIETRVLVKRDTGFKGYTYVWNDAGTDAVYVGGAQLKDATVGDERFSYFVPGPGDCQRCHVPAAGGVLGFEASQLNRGDQLAALARAGVLARVPADPTRVPALPDPRGAGDVASRARAWLHTQCAFCHNQDTGVGQGDFDLSFPLAFADTKLCDARPTHGDLGVANARLVAPGDAARSLVWLRAHSLDKAVRMPPLATSRRDSAGTELVKAWIVGLDGCD